MMDIAFILIPLVFFLVSWLYVKAYDKLSERS